MTRPCAAPDPIGESSHLFNHLMDLGNDVLAVDNDDRTFWRAESHVQDSSILRDINLLATEHRIDPRPQSAFVRQLKEKFQESRR